MIPERKSTVVRKHAATPRKSAPPRWPNPRQMEKTREPKASMVVRDVSSTAFPVLENTFRMLPLWIHRQNRSRVSPPVELGDQLVADFVLLDRTEDGYSFRVEEEVKRAGGGTGHRRSLH